MYICSIDYSIYGNLHHLQRTRLLQFTSSLCRCNFIVLIFSSNFTVTLDKLDVHFQGPTVLYSIVGQIKKNIDIRPTCRPHMSNENEVITLENLNNGNVDIALSFLLSSTLHLD